MRGRLFVVLIVPKDALGLGFGRGSSGDLTRRLEGGHKREKERRERRETSEERRDMGTTKERNETAWHQGEGRRR